MALTTIDRELTKAVAVSSSYLGSGNEIYIENCGAAVELWLDDDALVMTVKFRVGGGDFIEAPALAAKDVWSFAKRPGTDVLIDVKSDSGTPNVNVMVV